jgi:hypothetical protein
MKQSEIELLTLILSLVTSTGVPLIVQVLKGANWPKWAKYVLAALVSLAVGGLTATTQGQIDVADWAKSVIIVFTVSKIAYDSFFRAIFDGTPQG